LISFKGPGPRRKLNAEQRRALKEMVERGPIPSTEEVVRWRLIDLVQWLSDKFSVSLDETTVGRELKGRGFRGADGATAPLRERTSSPPRHLKKNVAAEMAAIRARLKPGTKIEIWFQDEARIGQKNRLTRPPLARHVHRSSLLGSCMIFHAGWYTPTPEESRRVGRRWCGSFGLSGMRVRL
jgi:transposase